MPRVGPGGRTHIPRAGFEQTEVLGSNTLLIITKLNKRNLVLRQLLGL